MSSWITGLADKAENILNKIDQNAATALQLETTALVTGDTINAMKKSMTSSSNSLSLKSTTLSPTKRSSASPSNASSVKSDQGASVSKRMTTSASFSTNPDSLGSAMDTHELAAFKIALNEITAERDELRMRLHELNHDSENLALQERSQELEILAQTLSEERDKAVHELNEAHTAHMAYVHSISELETNLAKLQQEYMSAAHKLQMQTKETEQHRLELHEYRTKAQRALQAKDALIAELKAKPREEASGEAHNSETRLLQIEYDALKQELEHAHEEVLKMRLQLEDNVAQEKQRELELSSARQREESLAKELRQAREYSLTSESEQRMLTQELASMRQQLSNQMAAAATRLQEREQQVQQLRQRLSGEVHTSAKNDYESRLKALTQSLVERQGLLERVTGERNALRLQYENMQTQLQQNQHLVQIESQRGSRHTILSNSTDDVKAQFPVLMHPSPFDNRVARRFKRALRQADSVGIRVGTFLRRYPMMRVSVIVYVALLHLWVMFVLLSTTPN
ncbi:GL21988 [Drosophila persimilis]|uniref:GL21988 n=1 Tax=Drosophila persimilis TaxID=7234 RepID=B4GEA9_DROPE|nr:golgin-84 [Drosophila persimilis]XP_026840133.1 golgin-84 [Drosophila persimilis]EDW33944.1 GL21988 [Drosophila persimilis]